MYSIGDFSRISRVTTKTLRYYDKIDLLKPERIDGTNGYRLYGIKQLKMMQNILAYKSMGFSLDDIKLMINNKNLIEELMNKRLNELNNELERTNKSKKVVTDFLKNIKKGEIIMSEIIIKSLTEVTVASMRTIIPNYNSYFEIVPKMGEYMNSVNAVCLEPAYCFTIYHDGEYKEANIDVEICEAVVSPCKDSEAVKFKTIKGYKNAATILHKGDYQSLGESYNKIFMWIEENSLEIADNPRESYIDGIWNRENPKDWLTEIQIPLKD